ncbi:MAG: monooxygenase, partial [Acidimicrobiales bacterium]|nr:monooxygenase [Acidimicrobiales bacterium]
IDPVWFDQLRPGWQSEWLRNFAILQTGGFTEEDLVKDGWTDIAKRIRDRVVAEVEAGGEFTDELVSKAFFDSDDEKMDEIRARVDRLVKDPATADALKPWYRQLCKRPCFHDEYLQTYNLPNVRLFDTDGMGVTAIDETGVWVGDEHVEVDCLIYASGFEVGTGLARRSGFETYGRDGISLSSAWADGMRTLHGVHVHGFPNFFLIGFAQAAGLVSNVTHNLVDGSTTIAAVIAHGLANAAQSVEVTAQAEQAWMDLLGSKGRPQFLADCTPGYYNNEGKTEDQSASFLDGYPGGAVAFFDYIEAWRNCGAFEGLKFR